MTPATFRAWSWVHTWSSLVCTVFLLMLCITGLPLIFHDEIEAVLNPGQWQPARPGAALLPLDDVLAIALERRPGEVPVFMSFDTDRPVINVTTAPSADAPAAAMHFASYDRTSGDLVPPAAKGEDVLEFLLQLHTDLFLGLPGMLFLGAIGVLFLAAIVSGVVVYGPYMQRQPFGVLRTGRSARLKWLDTHNLIGIVTIAWVAVVGLTGVVNTLATPIVSAWKTHELADLTAGAASAADSSQRASLDVAVAHARRAAPDMRLQFVAFPGTQYSTGRHYAVFLHGSTPLTSHIITPALVDATSGDFVAMRAMPWYAQALALAQPLHFGDYGRLPLKLLWAVFTVATIAVLLTGLYLWFAPREARRDV